MATTPRSGDCGIAPAQVGLHNGLGTTLDAHGSPRKNPGMLRFFITPNPEVRNRFGQINKSQVLAEILLERSFLMGFRK